MSGLIISSFLLGIAFCAPPGVVTAESLRRGLGRGFRAALLVQLGSLIGDATWAILALAGAAYLVQYDLVRLGLGAAGVLVLGWLAWGALQDARRGGMPQAAGQERSGGSAGGVSAGRDFVTGAVLSLSNPFAIAFWLGVGGSAVSSRVPDPQAIHTIVFFGAFMLGAVAWAFFLAALIARGRQLITPAFFRWVNLVCAGFLVYFAVQLAWNLIHVV